MKMYYVEVYCEDVYYVEKYYLMYMGVDRVNYYVEWVEMYQYYNLVRGTMVEATLLWASVERDMLDKKVWMRKYFLWWSVAQCARSKSASVGLGCNNFCSL